MILDKGLGALLYSRRDFVQIAGDSFDKSTGRRPIIFAGHNSQMVGEGLWAWEPMQVFKKAMLSGVGWYIDETDLLPRSLAPPAKVLGDFFGEADLAAGKKKERPFGRLAQAPVPRCARFARSVRYSM
jgi:hypothetical protein